MWIEHLVWKIAKSSTILRNCWLSPNKMLLFWIPIYFLGTWHVHISFYYVPTNWNFYHIRHKTYKRTSIWITNFFSLRWVFLVRISIWKAQSYKVNKQVYTCITFALLFLFRDHPHRISVLINKMIPNHQDLAILQYQPVNLTLILHKMWITVVKLVSSVLSFLSKFGFWWYLCLIQCIDFYTIHLGDSKWEIWTPTFISCKYLILQHMRCI